MANEASSSSSSRIAFAFDIDGVLVKGTHPIPGAQAVLRKLQDKKIPFILLTNSGGHTEEAHVARLGQRLGLALDPRQFVQSHTPYLDLVPRYRDETILALGGHGPQIRDLARAYGFRRVVTSSDVAVSTEHTHPFPEMTGAHHEEHGRRLLHLHHHHQETLALRDDVGDDDDHNPTRIAAIFVFSSPRDWCLDLQVVADLLLSRGGVLGGPRSAKNGDPALPNCGYQQDGQPELLFCNPDLEWATQHRHPRLAQGAFRAALAGVWRELTKGRAELRFGVCGKPSQTTFMYAEKTLVGFAASGRAAGGGSGSGGGSGGRVSDVNGEGGRGREGGVAGVGENAGIKTVYMVGDNPESDIAGANAYSSQVGLEWKSVLVETGVHVSGTRPAHQPTYIASNVKKAVEWALSQQG
ncbi:hypothetical protein MGN70_007814 [Eutypa lata]|nr:hypothetical protein MGN70_007814 [Eutypa lata]